jgi:hypothetical protein
VIAKSHDFCHNSLEAYCYRPVRCNVRENLSDRVFLLDLFIVLPLKNSSVFKQIIKIWLCQRLAIVMLLGTEGFDPLARAEDQYVNPGTSTWGEADRTIHHRYDANGSLEKKIIAVETFRSSRVRQVLIKV